MKDIKKINNWEVLTPNGWSSFKAVSKLQKEIYINVKFTDGTYIKCSENHKLKLASNEFIYVREIKKGMQFIGKDHILTVKSTRKMNRPIDLYDLNSVEKNNEFFANGVLSSNCALLEDGEELFSSASPALSTGGKCILLSCVTKDTMVITSTGIKEIGEFIDTSKIGGYEVPTYNVLGVEKLRCGNLIHNNGIQKTNIVKTKFSELECTNNHKLWAFKHDIKQYGWYKSEDLSVGDYISHQIGKRIWGNYTDISDFKPSVSNKIHSPFKPDSITPDLCYLVGLYISEGSVYKVRNKQGEMTGASLTITCGDDISWIFDKLNLIYNCWDGMHYTISNKNLIEFMEYLGFNLSNKAYQKCIPKKLLQLNEENTKWMLRGIFDGDGSATNRCVQLTSTSRLLINQVRMILSNFGIMGGIYLQTKEQCNNRKHSIKHNHDTYQFQIVGKYALTYFNLVGFNLVRKQDAISKHLVKNITRACSKDIIPNSLKLVNDLVDSSNLNFVEIKQKCGVVVNQYCNSKRIYKTDDIARQNVIALYSLFGTKMPNEYQNYWNTIIHENTVWCEITSITPSENETYDFSLQEDANDFWCHSVIYNGIIGHQTPRGVGNFFHKMWVSAEDSVDGKIGKNGFHPISLPWQLHPDRDEEWRRVAGLKQPSVKEAAREFDCDFLTSGDTVVDLATIEFYKKTFKKDPIECRYVDKSLWIWKYPECNSTYIVSADTSAGNDTGDYQACHVIDAVTLEQCAEYRGHINTKEFGNLLVALSSEYNNALLVIERQNTGYAVIQAVIDKSYPNLFYMTNDLKYVDVESQHNNNYNREEQKAQAGFSTNTQTRPLVISTLEQHMRERTIQINSIRTLSELETFIWKNGKAQAMQGYHDDLCVLGDTWVKTSAGYKMIKEVEVGEYVLTHKNRFKKVISKFINKSNNLKKLSSRGRPDLYITDNHPIQTFVTIPKSNEWKTAWKTISEFDTNSKYYTGGMVDMTVNDIKTIDLKQYATKSYICENDKLIPMVDNGITKYKHPQGKTLDRYLKIDNDFCFIMGYFLAEGCCGGHGIEFSSHIDEHPIRKVVHNYFTKLGLNTYGKTSTGKGGKTGFIGVSNKIFSNLFSEFGSDDTKKLPEWCMTLPLENQQHILLGYLVGDGCFKFPQITATTISPYMAFQLYEICIRLKIPMSLKRFENKIKFKEIRGKVYPLKPFFWGLKINNLYSKKLLLNYSDDILKCKHPNSKLVKNNVGILKFYGDIILGDIRKIENVDGEYTTYNLEVEEDNSYIANGTIVHNCMSLGIGLWIRATALKLRQQGIDLTKASLSHMNKTQLDTTPIFKAQARNLAQQSWEMSTGRSPNRPLDKNSTESLTWLL